MANTPQGSCRSTWLVDPGVGQLIGRTQLLQAETLYDANGFTRQWLWYAPIETTPVSDEGQRWVGCYEDVKSGDICAPSQVDFAYNVVLDKFVQRPLMMSTFAYGGRYIPRVCGNFFYPENNEIHSVPVPRATVEKFDDRNRNGQRDNGEAGLAGWQFRVVRVSSQFGDQGNGYVTTIATGGDGTVELRFDGLGPGAYQIEELGQDGWAPTTSAVQTIVVPDGAGDSHLGHLRFGNAETRADLVKVAFSLVDPPLRLEAGQSADLTIRAQLRNDGPADVLARDTIDISVPGDCVAEPAHAEVSRPLVSGAVAVVDFPVRIVCQDPSYHPMTFTDHLYIDTPGVSDPDLGNNTVAFEQTFPVFDRADIGLAATTVACPGRSDVDAEFTCVVATTVTNAGPYGPVNTDVAFTLTPPADCSAVDVAGSAAQSISLGVNEPRQVVSTWHLTCHQRSFHPINSTATATLNHLHVEDSAPGSGTAATQIEIFEPADLALGQVSIRCSERESSAMASDCTATVVATNNGPATAVASLVTMTITPEPGCTVTPSSSQQQALTLQSGQSVTVAKTWQLACPTMDRHATEVTATIQTSEPHAEDRVVTNNNTRAVWVPLDVKPRSLPSSINIGKSGLVPVAILSTATFNAMTGVDRATIRFGRTGTENSVISCAAMGEDVNGDGRLDLICHAETAQLSLTCDTTVLLLTAKTTQGTSLYSEDAVKVVGC